MLADMAEQYSQHLARVVAAQTAESCGFDAVQTSALEVLSDLLLRFIQQLGCTSSSFAQQAGRTDTNVNDVLLAFDELGISLDELKQYASQEEDVPFAHPVPQYPVLRPPTRAPSFAERREAPPPHIPSFLPAFPDKHTYVQTAAYAGQDKDARQQRLAANKAKRQAGKALVKLQQRTDAAVAALAPPAAAGPSSRPPVPSSPRASPAGGARMLSPAGLAGASRGGNPFLAQPLWEDGVSNRPAGRPVDEGTAFDFGPSATAPGDQHMEAESPMAAAAAAGEPSGWAGWKPDADAALQQSQQLGPQVPFRLDVAASIHRRAQLAGLKRSVEDAFAVEFEEQAGTEQGGQGKRQNAPRPGRPPVQPPRDPNLARAAAILQAGADAVSIDQQQQGAAPP